MCVVLYVDVLSVFNPLPLLLVVVGVLDGVFGASSSEGPREEDEYFGLLRLLGAFGILLCRLYGQSVENMGLYWVSMLKGEHKKGN